MNKLQRMQEKGLEYVWVPQNHLNQEGSHPRFKRCGCRAIDIQT